jgi:uncharacterized protein (DUF1697 family)
MTSAPAGKTIRHAALLRGVNVGGNKKLAMADLRQLLSDLGYEQVSTLLQSGNAVFTAAAAANGRALAATIESALASRLGLSSRVTLRTHRQLAEVIDENPFPSAEQDPAKHLVQFLFDPLTPADRDKIAALDAANFAPEEFRLGPEVIYFRLPGGIGRSRLNVAFGQQVTAKMVMTGRNWNTVRKLLELTAD